MLFVGSTRCSFTPVLRGLKTPASHPRNSPPSHPRTASTPSLSHPLTLHQLLTTSPYRSYTNATPSPQSPPSTPPTPPPPPPIRQKLPGLSLLPKWLGGGEPETTRKVVPGHDRSRFSHSHWTPKQVYSYFIKAGIPKKAAGILLKAEVKGGDLEELTHKSLKELGVSSLKAMDIVVAVNNLVESEKARLSVLVVPRFPTSISDRILIFYFVREGEHVYKDDLLATLEGEDRTIHVYSPAEGTIVAMNTGEGANVKVGEEVMLIDVGSTHGIRPSKEEREERERKKKERERARASKSRGRKFLMTLIALPPLLAIFYHDKRDDLIRWTIGDQEKKKRELEEFEARRLVILAEREEAKKLKGSSSFF